MKNTTNIILGLVILVIVFGLGMMAKNIFGFGAHNSVSSEEAVTGDNFKTAEITVADNPVASFKNLETTPASGGTKKLHYDIELMTTSPHGSEKLNDNADDVAAIIGTTMASFDPEKLVSGEKMSLLKMTLLTNIMTKYPSVKIKHIEVSNIVYN